MTTHRYSRTTATAMMTVTVAGVLSMLTSCADRLEPPAPVTYADTDAVTDWAASHAAPYGIPERALAGYAYAAWSTEQNGGCGLGWPTLAALGAILSDHGRAFGSEITDSGTTTIPLRGLNLINPAFPMIVPDTDEGRIDGDTTLDIPVGPMQIMPSRWEQFGALANTNASPGATPAIDNIDDAALTTATILCAAGDMSNSEAWDSAIKSINPDPEFVKAVHAKAEEYSR